MLGNNSEAASPTPVQVIGVSTATQLTACGGTSCAVLADGIVKCWGGPGDGVLNTGPTEGYALIPAAVDRLAGVKEVQATGSAYCALLLNGSVRCWGRNDDRSFVNLGSAKLAGVKRLGDGVVTSCAILSADSSVQCWSGASGAPSAIAGLPSGVTQVSNECALFGDGSIRCWGHDASFQTGTINDVNPPTLVPPLGAATLVAAGQSHVCAVLSSDKSLSCWGQDGNFGAIDYGTIPLPINGVSQVMSVSMSEFNTCAVQADHVVKCWGSNQWGQLGDGTWNSADVPVAVKGLPSGD